MGDRKYNPNTPAVMTHLEILQGIINRMARNSASCKQWCITIVAAMLLLSFRQDDPLSYILIPLIPTIVFYGLDAYYLALENSFRDLHNLNVAKLHAQTFTLSDLYVFRPPLPVNAYTHKVMRSLSTSIFYGGIAISLLTLYLVLAIGNIQL